MSRKNLLVDGQQRISTLHEYVQGSPDLVLEKVKSYATLDEAEKKRILDYQVAVRDLGSVTEKQIKDIFTRINATDYSLKAIERLNALFNGEYKQFCDDLSRHDIFTSHYVFSMADYRRMRDLDFCVILVTTALTAYYHRDSINMEYLRRYNDRFPKKSQIKKQFDDVFNTIEACGFEKKCRVWKKTDLFTLIIEMVALERSDVELDSKKMHDALTAFYSEVDAMFAMKVPDDELEKKAPHPDLFRYLKAATKASNDKYARVERAEVISAILKKCVKTKEPKKKK